MTNSKKTADKTKPLLIKRKVNQVTAITLFNVLGLMRGSAGEKTHRERLQTAILNLFPEAKEGGRAPISEKRVLEIDRRQMYALIYGMVWAMDNTTEIKDELSKIYFGIYDYFGQLKKLSEQLGLWSQIQELIKPDTTPEWEGDFGEIEDEELLSGNLDDEDGEAGSEEKKAAGDIIPSDKLPD